MIWGFTVYYTEKNLLSKDTVAKILVRKIQQKVLKDSGSLDLQEMAKHK